MPKTNAKKRYKLNKIKISELSSVDKPAQEGAKALIMKRDDTLVLLTVADDTGHSHLLEPLGQYTQNETSYSYGEGDERGHHHPFVIKDGKVIIGEVDGHTHTVDDSEASNLVLSIAMLDALKQDLELSENATFKSIPETMELIKSWEAKTGNNIDNPLDKSSQPEKIMPTPKKPDATPTVEDLQKSLDDANKNLSTLTEELKLAKSVSELNDAHKAHYLTLKGSEAIGFLAKSVEDKDAVIEALKSDDPVVYKSSVTGMQFRKSDDPRLIEMAKSTDADRATLQKQQADLEFAQLEKRAATEIPHLPGTVANHIALLKAVDTIEDQIQRDEVIALLKAQDAKLGKNFEVVGEGGEPVTVVDKKEAVDELDRLAKAYAKERNIDFYKAYHIVSEQNTELLQKAL